MEDVTAGLTSFDQLGQARKIWTGRIGQNGLVRKASPRRRPDQEGLTRRVSLGEFDQPWPSPEGSTSWPPQKEA